MKVLESNAKTDALNFVYLALHSYQERFKNVFATRLLLSHDDISFFSTLVVAEMGGLEYKTIQEPCPGFRLAILVKVYFAGETIKRPNNGSRLTRKCKSRRYTCSPPSKPPRTSPSPPPSPRPRTPSFLSPSSPLDVTLHLGFVLNWFCEVRAYQGCSESHFWRKLERTKAVRSAGGGPRPTVGG